MGFRVATGPGFTRALSSPWERSVPPSKQRRRNENVKEESSMEPEGGSRDAVRPSTPSKGGSGDAERPLPPSGRAYACLLAYPVISVGFLWGLINLCDCEPVGSAGEPLIRSAATYAWNFVGNLATFTIIYHVFAAIYDGPSAQDHCRANGSGYTKAVQYELTKDYVAAAFTDMVMAAAVSAFSVYGLFKLAWAGPEDRTAVVLKDYHAMNRIAQNGEVFTAYLMFDCLRMGIAGRLRKDWQATVHHSLFLTIGFIVRFFTSYPLWASAAMAQEISSPFLKLVRLRQAFGKSRAQIAPVFIIFAICFFISRIVVYPIFAVQMVYDTYMGHLPRRVPVSLQCIVAVLGTLAIFLQLFFFSGILRILCDRSKKKGE